MATASSSGSPISDMKRALGRLPGWLAQRDGSELGDVLVEVREVIDRSEAVFAQAVRRFEQSGQFRADGALSVADWVRTNCKLSGTAAAERVEVARQLEHLPQTKQAFAQGDIGYQHAAVLARAAENVGVAAVRKAESGLLQAAGTMDPGQFVGMTKNWEHRVDAEGALAEKNRAYARRFLHLGEPQNGLVKLDGLLDTEGGAIVRTTLDRLMKPDKSDERSYGQRTADALVELCRAGGQVGKGHSVPQLIVRAAQETLVGAPGAPGGELDRGGPVPAETVRRLACDAALTRIVGRGELEEEISRLVRTCPPSTRRALDDRDRHCQVRGCTRPAAWCDAHHVQHWIDGGPTTLPNLILLCRRHHTRVHEEGWSIRRHADGRSELIPPARVVPAHARSA